MNVEKNLVNGKWEVVFKSRYYGQESLSSLGTTVDTKEEAVEWVKMVKEEAEKNLPSFANNLWQQIGPDVLGPECGSPSIPGTQVREIVADQMEFWLSTSATHLLDFWKALTFNEVTNLMKKVFPLRRYGW